MILWRNILRNFFLNGKVKNNMKYEWKKAVSRQRVFMNIMFTLWRGVGYYRCGKKEGYSRI